MDSRAPLALLSLALLAAPASAGVVRGSLRIASPAPPAAVAANPYPGRANAMAGHRGVERGLVTDAVVFVERLPAGADSTLPRAPAPPRLAQRNQTFVPRVVVVATGERVEFPNMDPIYHNVFSPSPAKRFDLGKYPKGQSRGVVFPRPGVVRVFCDIHSDMEAFVLVLANRAFARPDKDGHWSLPDLPPGPYVIRVWHPDFREIQHEVTVPAEGVATLELSL